MTTGTTADQAGTSAWRNRASHAARDDADAEATAQIAQLCERIDEIDTALIALWRERASLSQQVGVLRVAAGAARLAVTREHEVLGRFHRELGPIGTELGLLVLRAGRTSV